MLDHTGGLFTFGRVLDVEGHRLTSNQRPALGLDFGVMHEQIEFAFALDEPETLPFVEPLYRACLHTDAIQATASNLERTWPCAFIDPLVPVFHGIDQNELRRDYETAAITTLAYRTVWLA